MVRGDLIRCRHRVSKLLLLHGRLYDGGAWTKTHRRWLAQLRLRPPAARRGRLALPSHPAPARQRPPTDQRAWNAQVRLHQRYRHLTEHGKRPTVVNVAIARELIGFLWAAMTDQPLTIHDQPQEAAA